MLKIKNILSKNIKESQNTIKELINTCDCELFSKLCENSSSIFPFIRERISKDFVKLVNKENLNVIFEFSKIYCREFEDMIVNSWLKFADEDLTDALLELLNSGTDEQKAYAAKYFSYIQDSLSLDMLQKEAYSAFSPLKINCARTLQIFGDKKCLEDMKKVVTNSQDDFEKLAAFNFICAYGGADSIKFVLKEGIDFLFGIDVFSNLLEFSDFQTIKNILNESEIIKLFSVIQEGYPELIELNTVEYYGIADFISYIYKINTQFARNSLLIAKAKFNEFSTNEMYLYDVDKNIKTKIKEISNSLNSMNLNYDSQKDELNCYDTDTTRFNLSLDVIKEYKISSFAPFIADLINSQKLSDNFIAKSAQVLYELKQSDLIDFKKIEEIKNENIKALIKSLI